jgi:WD40 repeat protein
MAAICTVPVVLYLFINSVLEQRWHTLKHDDFVASIAFTADGKKLISAGVGLTVWDVTARLPQARKLPRNNTQSSANLVVISSQPDGNDLIVSGSTSPPSVQMRLLRDGIVQGTTDFAQGQLTSDHIITLVPLSNGNVISCKFASGPRSNAGRSDSTLQLYEITSDKVLGDLPMSRLPSGEKPEQLVDDTVRTVDITRDGKLLAWGDAGGLIRLWDMQSRNLLRTIIGTPRHREVMLNAEITGVAFSPDGKILSAGGENRTVRLWDTQTGQLLQTLPGGMPGGVLLNTVVAFSPDAKKLATAGQDDSIQLWEVDTGRLLHKYKEHTRTITDLAFSPDGSILASSSEDRTVKLWRIQ